MSNKVLSPVESRITAEFNEFSNAVIEDNKSLGNELIILLQKWDKTILIFVGTAFKILRRALQVNI